MEEDSEFEGEDLSYRDDDNSIDPDTDLSYLDEKIQNVLGHQRKYFEADVSKEKLGSKYGGYGSFLPTYECSPPNWSHSKTPQRDSTSLCNLSMEGTSQNFQPTSIVSSMRLGSISCSDSSLQYSGMPPSVDVPVKHGSRLSLTQVAESSVRSGNLMDQRTLRVRIKLGSDKMTRKNVAIYSGLGLDNSPSSSLGNSAEESRGTKPVSPDTSDESPTSILQVMTSFPVPGDVLISPLHDSLLCLIRKERLSRDVEHVFSLRSRHQQSSVLVDESVACMGNRKLVKEKKKNLLGKSARPVQHKLETVLRDENDTASLLKKELENETSAGKEINHLNFINLSNSECVFGSLKGLDGASEVSRGGDKDGVIDRWFSSNLMTEDSLESISHQNSGKGQKNGRSRSVEKVSEQWDSGGHKGNKASTILIAHSGASKCNKDTTIPSKLKVGKKPPIRVQDEINLCSRRMKPLSEGKKSKSNQSRGKSGVASINESLTDGQGVAPKDMTTTSYGASTGKRKMPKLKPQKDINMARDICKDSLDAKLEPTNNQSERPYGEKPNKKVDNQAMPGPHIKDAPFVGPSTIEGRHCSEIVPAVVNPVVINENWVCCDNCQKWRLLPFGTKPEHLPDNWLCSMLNWLPGMNRCDISEEETTKALYALYQVPAVEGQNNDQNYANGVASWISLDHGQHLDQKNQSPYSAVVSIRAKKRYASEEIPKAGGSGAIQRSNAAKNHLQVSVRSRRLNDMKQRPAESNVMKKSSSLHFNKSCNLDVEKHIAKQKEKLMNGGDSKQLKMKKKRVTDQYGHGSSKKAKRVDKYVVDKRKNSDLERGRMSLKSNAGLQTEAGGKNILRCELPYSEDAKYDTRDTVPLSGKKLGGQTQVSSDGGSLDTRTSDKRNNSLTKRKWHNNRNANDSKVYAKGESSESGLGREKKSRFQKTDGRDSGANKGSDNKYNNRVAPFFLLKGHLVDGTEEARVVDKGQKIRKHGKSLNGIDFVKRDFGSGEVLVAATSSSSKVSCSRRSRANFEEVKSSPVESVSSSPFRTSYPDKLTSAAEDNLGKDDTGIDCVPVKNNCERCWDGKVSDKINLSGTGKKDKGSCNCHPQLLKCSAFDYYEGNVNHKIAPKSKVSSVLGNGHLLNVDTDSFEYHQHPGDLFVMEHGNDEGRGNQNYHENVLFPQKVDEGSFLQPNDSNRKCASVSYTDKMKISNSLSEHGRLYLKKDLKYESDFDADCNAQYHETISEGKNQFPEGPMSKFHKEEEHRISRRDFEIQIPSNGRMGKQVTVKAHYDSDLKLHASTSRAAASQHNLMEDLEGEVKASQVERETIGMSNSLSHCESENEQRARGHQSVPRSIQGGMFGEILVDDSYKTDTCNALNHSGDAGNKNGVSRSLGHHTTVIRGVKDVNVPNPRSVNSSSQNATIVLKEAKELRDYADRLKNSGFDFESNEAYFQAALKFLHGASLLESCTSEGGRSGEMTQIQAYRTTAKLCEFCAHEYARRQEMAAASLAYKCTEVAYMRVVYYKNSSTSKDRIELQATLQFTSQGESPSSSASDVDNLNNLVTMDKATLSKGTVSHFTGSHVIVTRKHPHFVRLLDFTQDVDFAMEASRKSQNAFAAASVTMEEIQNRECITVIKRVIDFSFQDVEGLLPLVRLAMEAINRSGFGGARD